MIFLFVFKNIIQSVNISKTKSHFHSTIRQYHVFPRDLQQFMNAFIPLPPNITVSSYHGSTGGFRTSSSESLMSLRHISLCSLEGGLTYFWLSLWPFHESQFLIKYLEPHLQTVQLEYDLTIWRGVEIKYRRFWNMFTTLNYTIYNQNMKISTMSNRYCFSGSSDSFLAMWLILRCNKLYPSLTEILSHGIVY